MVGTLTLPLPKSGTGLMTIAFDLDGTLAEATWPEPFIGAPIRRGVDAAFAYADKGYEIIVFTSRPASHAGGIRDWTKGVSEKEQYPYGRTLYDIVYDIITDKPRAAMYVDDRAVTFPEAFEVQPEASPSLLRWTHTDEQGRPHEHTLYSGKREPDHDHGNSGTYKCACRCGKAQW